MRHETGAPQEARHGREPEIGSEAGLHRTQPHDIETGAISPVSISFGIDAVGSIVFHRNPDRCDGPVDDANRQLRLVFSDGQGSVGHPRIADLVPVMFRGQPAIVSFVERRLQSLLQDGIPDGLFGGVGKLTVQPVITDGHRHGHLSHIQEMGWIPIAESRDRQHFPFGTVQVFPVSGHSICVRQLEDPTDGFPGLIQQSSTDLDALKHGQVNDPVGFFQDGVMQGRPGLVALDGCLQCFFLTFLQEDAGMRSKGCVQIDGVRGD